MRIDPHQKWNPVYLLQPVYNVLLMAFFEWGVAFHDLDLEAIRKGEKSAKALKRELKGMARKAGRQIAKDYLAYPALSGRKGFKSTLTANFTANVIRNVWAHAIIFCGHFPDQTYTFSQDEVDDETRGGFYVRQLLGAANIEGSPLFHVISGNLGYQVEHHLYPDMPSTRYAEIAPQVKEICERYELPYNTGPFLQAVGQVQRTILRLAFPGGRRAPSRARTGGSERTATGRGETSTRRRRLRHERDPERLLLAPVLELVAHRGPGAAVVRRVDVAHVGPVAALLRHRRRVLVAVEAGPRRERGERLLAMQGGVLPVDVQQRRLACRDRVLEVAGRLRVATHVELHVDRVILPLARLRDRGLGRPTGDRQRAHSGQQPSLLHHLSSPAEGCPAYGTQRAPSFPPGCYVSVRDSVRAMRAAFISSFDADDPASVVEVGDRPEPSPPDGWVVVEVRAAALNHHDVWSARGIGLAQEQLPMILGCDAAGVDPDGREVVVHGVVNDPAWVGPEELDPKLALLSEGPQGALAERVAVPAGNLVPKPPELSFEEAACLPTAWLTAYRMLFAKAELRPGDTVLVQGASGGLAGALIRLGAAAGLRVWVTGRDEEKRAFAERLGAHATFESGARLPERVDAVMDSVGAPTFKHSIRSLRRGGVLVSSGGTGGYVAEVELARLFRLNLRILGSTMGTREELDRLVRFCVERDLRPDIDAVLPLEETPGAVARMASSDVRGKIVLTP